MSMEDYKLEKAFSSVSVSSITVARMCLSDLIKCRENEVQYKLLATIPCAKRLLENFVNNVVGYSGMNIIFPTHFDELYEFIHQDKGVVTFLDFNANVVTERISTLQALPYPSEGVTIYNPHIGLTAEGYFPRLSAVTATITFYDKWIGLITKFIELCNEN